MGALRVRDGGEPPLNQRLQSASSAGGRRAKQLPGSAFNALFWLAFCGAIGAFYGGAYLLAKALFG